MNSIHPPTTGSSAENHALSGIYLWQNHGILLIGQSEDDQYVLARGWIEHDRLAHVRRWKFTSIDQFSHQVRRLVMEASQDTNIAGRERDTARYVLGHSASS